MGQGLSLFGDVPAYSREDMNRSLKYIPNTFGDKAQVGRVWVARSGKASSHGHLSILVAVDGNCVFDEVNEDIPTIFHGAQYHVGLAKDENGRYTRSTTFIAEAWYPKAAAKPNLEPRPFIVDDRVQLFPCLNEDGSYAQIENLGSHNPRAWASELDLFGESVYDTLIMSPDEIKAADENEEDLEEHVNNQSGGARFVNEPIPGNPKRWSASINCHTFAVRFVHALSLRWPTDLVHSGEYKDWLVDALTVQYKGRRAEMN